MIQIVVLDDDTVIDGAIRVAGEVVAVPDDFHSAHVRRVVASPEEMERQREAAQRKREEIEREMQERLRPRPVQFREKIERLPEDGLIGLWVVGGREVLVMGETRVTGRPPRVGRRANVVGTHVKGEPVRAETITVIGAERRGRRR